ncbi:hypothetical protein N7492_006859 [Penicillium capsulatum]|uniref:Uncharacterized protein n=1 Tax=Penicillium capsulatum TaxID=69766 RepID=A0A9W9HYR2_9EURO|nr:hypothetical protein N7492_006859 [Penicillium capsulatum]KAJ6116693.1 hypothetical protein N7512_006418 [Penicillium capsulatum]
MPSSSTVSLSRWWPASFFISFVIFLIIGIALSAKWGSTSYDKCKDAYQNHREDFDNDKCVNQDTGLLYGAIVCFIICAASFFTSCVFLIVYCVRRNRSRNTEQQQPFLAPQPYGHPEQGIPFSQYPPSEYPPNTYAGPPAPTPMVPQQYTYDVPLPGAVNEACQHPRNMVFRHGITIVKISPVVVAKFGAHVNTIEAKNMIHVAENSRVPVPKVFAYYTYRPIDHDIGDYGSLYDTYIFMSFIDGQTLDRAWETFDTTSKSRITGQPPNYIGEIRDMGSVEYIGSIDNE